MLHVIPLPCFLFLRFALTNGFVCFLAVTVTASYPLANDPGMTNTTQILCVATVDLDDPRNQNAKPRADDEFIVTHFVELPQLLSTIEGTRHNLTSLSSFAFQVRSIKQRLEPARQESFQTEY